MSQPLFLLGDADNVRKRIQGLLLAGDLDALKILSAALSRHIAELGSSVADAFAAEIVFCGGDELLALADGDAFEKETLGDLMLRFKEKTDVTISFGVGRSAGEAFINLSRAKSAGPGSMFLVDAVAADRPVDGAND